MRLSLFIVLISFNCLSIHSQQPVLIVPIGHTSIVNTVAFSIDGKKIITSSDDFTAKIWEAVSGKLLAILSGHTKEVTSAMFSPDSRYILTTSKDNTAKIWDAYSGKLLREFKDVLDAANFSHDCKKVIATTVFSCTIWDIETGEQLTELIGAVEPGNSFAAFSPDDKRIITLTDENDEYTSDDNTAQLWDTETGEMISKMTGHKDFVRGASFSPKGEKIVTVSDDGIAKVWDGITGKFLLNLTGHSGSVNMARFSPDGKLIVTASNDKTAKIWNVSTGKLLYSLKGHKEKIGSVQFSPNGKFIVTASEDKVVKVWNVNGVLLATLSGHGGKVKAACFSPDSKRIATASADNSAKIWDVKTGRLVFNLTGNTTNTSAAVFSPDDSKVVTASFPPRVWDIKTGKIKFNLEGHTSKWINSVAFTNDGKKVVTTSGDHTAKIWSALTGKLLQNLEGHSSQVWAAQFIPDGKFIVTSSWDNTAKIWDVDSGKLLHSLEGHSSLVKSAQFSSDGKFIVTSSWDDTVKLWDATTGSLLDDFTVWYGYAGGLHSASFSPDGTKVVTAAFGNDYVGHIWDVKTHTISGELVLNDAGDSKAYFAAYLPNGKRIVTDEPLAIWDGETGKLVTELIGYKGNIINVAFSNDSKKIVSVSDDNTAQIWDVEIAETQTNSKKITRGPHITLRGHAARINKASFSNNGEKIITSSDDGTCKLWDVNTGKLINTFFATDSADYFNQTTDGYYFTTQKLTKLLHYVTKDLKVITFEQLDVKYNRPDKVLEAIGNTDTALIKSYRKAWEKRIKKLGIDTTAFRDGYSVPEADFTNRDAIEYEQNTGTLKLIIKGNDSTYKLDRFNVWVNETPIFGQRGISIRKRNKNDFDTTITVKLSQGENRIETAITNVNGTESYRMPLTVNYTPAVKQRESVRFIGIGIDQFADNQYNLQYSAKDIRDLSKKLKEKYKDDIIIDTLFNENVTTGNVKALKQKLLQTTENDKVIIAYSGHGMLSKEYDYYLSTYSVNFEKPEQNGLPYDELENLLDSIPARKKLMLIDACHSGEVDKDDLVTLNASSDSLIKGLKPVAYKKEGNLGLKNSFELMQSLFVNVGKSTGATIISAAAGTQFALERNDLKNGVFTYSILEAMNKYPTMKISELKKTVGERVEQLTKGLQKPTSRNETIAVDWNLW